jgi:hypothetical protein
MSFLSFILYFSIAVSNAFAYKNDAAFEYPENLRFQIEVVSTYNLQNNVNYLESLISDLKEEIQTYRDLSPAEKENIFSNPNKVIPYNPTLFITEFIPFLNNLINLFINFKTNVSEQNGPLPQIWYDCKHIENHTNLEYFIVQSLRIKEVFKSLDFNMRSAPHLWNQRSKGDFANLKNYFAEFTKVWSYIDDHLYEQLI